MADEDNETNSSETDALLADLERRAAGGGAAASSADEEGDDEDLEAFLASLEDEEIEASTDSKPADSDPLASEFAELEKTAPPEPEPAAEKDEGADKKEKKKVKAVEKGESDGLKKVAAVIRWAFYLVPTLIAIWVLGAALAHWVSAAWLVLIISCTTIFGVAAALRLSTKKGTYGLWLGALATLVSVGFLAAATGWSGSALAKFGHWPTSAVAEAAGWPADHGAVAANAWVGEVIGGQLSKLRDAQPQQAHRLGGQVLLSKEADEGGAESDGVDSTEKAPAIQPGTTDQEPETPGAAEPEDVVNEKPAGDSEKGENVQEAENAGGSDEAGNTEVAEKEFVEQASPTDTTADVEMDSDEPVAGEIEGKTPAEVIVEEREAPAVKP